ncbi:MAG: hypothetical protein V4594_16870 [Bacteroidota bacterium]
MAVYTFTNLMDPQNTASGISDFILLAAVADFEADGIKCPEAPFATPGDKVKITSPHVFKTDKAFAKIICAPEKNQLNVGSIGDTGFTKGDFNLEMFVPGSYAELHEAMGEYLNRPLIALVKDSNCGANQWYQLGCDCVFANLKWDFSTGTTKDGVKGYKISVTYQNGYILLYDVAGGPEILGD